MTNNEKFDFFVESLRNHFGKEVISDHMIEICISACRKVASDNKEINMNGLSLIQRFMVIQNSGIFNKAMQQIKSDTSDKKIISAASFALKNNVVIDKKSLKIR